MAAVVLAVPLLAYLLKPLIHRLMARADGGDLKRTDAVRRKKRKRKAQQARGTAASTSTLNPSSGASTPAATSPPPAPAPSLAPEQNSASAATLLLSNFYNNPTELTLESYPTLYSIYKTYSSYFRIYALFHAASVVHGTLDDWATLRLEAFFRNYRPRLFVVSFADGPLTAAATTMPPSSPHFDAEIGRVGMHVLYSRDWVEVAEDVASTTSDIARAIARFWCGRGTFHEHAHLASAGTIESAVTPPRAELAKQRRRNPLTGVVTLSRSDAGEVLEELFFGGRWSVRYAGEAVPRNAVAVFLETRDDNGRLRELELDVLSPSAVATLFRDPAGWRRAALARQSPGTSTSNAQAPAASSSAPLASPQPPPLSAGSAGHPHPFDRRQSRRRRIITPEAQTLPDAASRPRTLAEDLERRLDIDRGRMDALRRSAHVTANGRTDPALRGVPVPGAPLDGTEIRR